MLPNDIVLRQAEANDWTAIKALLGAQGLPIEGAAEHLSSFLLAIADGTVVGCAGTEFYGAVALIRSVAVASDLHRQGIGRLLVNQLILTARLQGASSLHLLTLTASDYFAGYGFKPGNRDEAPEGLKASAEFKGACPASAMFMSLSLEPTSPAPARLDSQVRVATPADARAIAEIYAPIVRDTGISFELDPPTVEQIRERIAATLPTLPWLVSVDARGAVSGYAYASRHRERAAYQWAVDTTIYIRPSAQGQGLGKKLYQELKGILIELGYFQAFAGIALPNVASVALHEAVGFVPIGVYRDVGFKNGQWRDVGWWQCRLRPAMEPSPLVAFGAWSSSRSAFHQDARFTNTGSAR